MPVPTKTQTETLLDAARTAVQLDYVGDRARALVITKIDEALLWLTKCREPVDLESVQVSSSTPAVER